jgi:hypothetical protein
VSYIRLIILTATAVVFLGAGSSMLFAQGLITQKGALARDGAGHGSGGR